MIAMISYPAVALIALILVPASLSLVLLPSKSYEQNAQTNFPPDKYYKLRENPSYAIIIPEVSSNDTTQFTPREVSIPADMTVFWTNNDNDVHSITTISNATYSPPEVFASKLLEPDGGTFEYSFMQVGTYHYVDGHHPNISGVINVGNGMATGKHMNMMIGGLGVLPFNPSRPQSFVVSFIPKDVGIPPYDSMLYNVTISNSTSKFYAHTFATNSGILDLELLPSAKSTGNSTYPGSSQFKTWGPDIIGVNGHTTGTYHIKGPFMTDPTQYFLTVRILTKDGKPLNEPPIIDQFILPPRVNNITSVTSAANGTEANNGVSVPGSNTTITIVPYEGSNVTEIMPHQMPPAKSTKTNPAP